MNHRIWPASVAGLISTAVIFGTDVFFVTVGRPALRSAAESDATEVMDCSGLAGGLGPLTDDARSAAGSIHAP
jgi:hypothetical protein